MFWVWKRVALFFLCIETLLFALVYMYGPHGLSMLSHLEESYYRTEVRCQVLHEKIGRLEHDIVEWEDSEFLREKIARERLLMKKPGETIYFI